MVHHVSRYVRIICEYVGLFYEYVGLFCGYVGLFCEYIGLMIRSIILDTCLSFRSDFFADTYGFSADI